MKNNNKNLKCIIPKFYTSFNNSTQSQFFHFIRTNTKDYYCRRLLRRFSLRHTSFQNG